MLERTIKSAALLLLACLLLSSCAHFSASGRQQLAYAKYVRKQSHNRVRQQTKFKKVRVPTAPTSSEPKISTEASQGPESVTTGQPEPDNQ